MLDVSAYQTLPSESAATVLNNGIPWNSRWAASSSATDCARFTAANCANNLSLSIFASR